MFNKECATQAADGLGGWAPASANLYYNKTLLKKIDSNSDLRGAIGITSRPNGYLDHGYTSLNWNSTYIAESTDRYGIRTSRNCPTQWIDKFYKKGQHFSD